MIADQKAEIDLYKTQVDIQHEQIVNAFAENERIQAEESAWYHNPVIIGIMGFLVGGVTYGLLKK